MKAPSVHWSEFRFNSGRPCLDLPATVRRRASTPYDVLAPPGEAARWLAEAGLVERGTALAPTQVRQLAQLREAIWAAASALSRRGKPPASALAVINRAAGYPLPVPQLVVETCERVSRARNAFQSALSVLARDAIELLAGGDARRIKACAQADCGMLFFDASPGERRRWCSMDRCGSRAKCLTYRLEKAGRARPARGARNALGRRARGKAGRVGA